MKFILSILPEKLGICHLAKNGSIPDWATSEGDFYSVSRTPDELSIVCSQKNIPAGVLAERDWRAFKVQGPLGFTLTGIISSLSAPLAGAEISIFYISTYETDYVLVKDENLERAKEILRSFCDIRE